MDYDWFKPFVVIKFLFSSNLTREGHVANSRSDIRESYYLLGIIFFPQREGTNTAFLSTLFISTLAIALWRSIAW